MFTLIMKWKEAIVPVSLVALVFVSCRINSGPPGTDTFVKIIIDAAGNFALKRLHAES
jgi:hypothetical protein